MNKQYVILLTGCINPKGMAYTVLNDTQTRKHQYLEAINFYLQKTSLPVVFCENTMADIINEELKIFIQEERFEYITFDGNNFDKTLGKGYGECEIIEYAYKHSKLIQDTPFIIKITGRIIIPDINLFVKRHSKSPNITIQALMPNIKNRQIDSRLIIAPSLFFPKYFVPLKKNLDDSKGYYFEHLLFDTILYQKEMYYIPYLSYPHFQGLSGSLGVPFFPYEKIHALYYKKDCCRFTMSAYKNYPTKKIPTSLHFNYHFLLYQTIIELYFLKIKEALINGKLYESFKL